MGADGSGLRAEEDGAAAALAAGTESDSGSPAMLGGAPQCPKAPSTEAEHGVQRAEPGC